jgi:hypothetical protein
MPDSVPKSLSFTVRYDGRTNQLLVKTLVSKPSPPGKSAVIPPVVVQGAKEYVGIWDTGATNCVISQKVIDECGLKPTGIAMVHGATDPNPTPCETFLVNIFLPNRVVIPSIRVTKGSLVDCDVLIGMDIINRGDFAITHYDGKTTFSFRLPSMQQIDFVESKPEPSHSTKISRNSPCPCGSGKKYKKCCGRNVV